MSWLSNVVKQIVDTAKNVSSGKPATGGSKSTSTSLNSGNYKSQVDPNNSTKGLVVANTQYNNPQNQAATTNLVNKTGLSGQALAMANALEEYGSYAKTLGPAAMARYMDKVNNFNSLAVDQKQTAGVYKPTAVADYRAWNPGDSVAGRDYTYDERTGAETGNNNLINSDYDLMRDQNYNYLDQFRETTFANEYANLVRSGQLSDDPETRAWFMSLKGGWNEKAMDGWDTTGIKSGSNTAYVPLKNTGVGVEPGNNIPKSSPQINPGPQTGPKIQAPQTSPVPQTSPQNGPSTGQFVSTIIIRDASGNAVDQGYVAADGTSYVRTQDGQYVPTRQAYNITGYDPNSKTATIAGGAVTNQVGTALATSAADGYVKSLQDETAGYNAAMDKYMRELDRLSVEDFIDLARETYDPMRASAEQNIDAAFDENNRAAEVEAEARGLSGSDLTNIRRTANADVRADAISELLANYNQMVNQFATQQYGNATDKLNSKLSALEKKYSTNSDLLKALIGDTRAQESEAWDRSIDERNFNYNATKDTQSRADALEQQAWERKTTEEKFAYDKWYDNEKLKLEKQQLSIAGRRTDNPADTTYNDWGAVYQSVSDALATVDSSGRPKVPEVTSAQLVLDKALATGKISTSDAKSMQDLINQAGYRMLSPAGTSAEKKKVAPKVSPETSRTIQEQSYGRTK